MQLKKKKKNWEFMKAYNFNKSNTPPWVFLTFFKLYQMVPNSATRHLFSKMVNKPMFPFHNPSKNANDVVLVFLSLTLNMFHNIFYCLYCWLWTSKC